MIFKSIFVFHIFIGFLSASSRNFDPVCSTKFNLCYQYIASEVPFPLAELTCTDFGGHLATIQNDEQNSFIASIGRDAYQKIGEPDYWIGANNLADPKNWKWTSGLSLNYSNWKVNPVDQCASQDYTGEWHAFPPRNTLPFICGFPISTNATTVSPTTRTPITCPTPTPCPVQNCTPSCDLGWTYFANTDYCYKVYHHAKWADAEQACVLLGAHLASVHSWNEDSFINKLAACGIKETDYYNLAWIGMHKSGGSWVWSDGSPVGYMNWAPKQPDNPGTENCVQTVPDVSHKNWFEEWNNLDCNTVMRAYICKKPSYHN